MEMIKVGERLKKLREDLGVSLQQMSERTGLTSALLSQMENHLISPPLGALFKIARALGVPVGKLLDDSPGEPFAIERAAERQKVSRFASKEGVNYGYSYESLGHGKKNRKMEPFIVTLEPETVKNTHLSSHEGEEFINVLEGEMVVQLGEHSDVLGPGDCIYYDSSIPHKVACKSNQPTKILAVLHGA